MIGESENHMTVQTNRYSLSAADLVKEAAENPPQPVIEDLQYTDDICLVHGLEECFKSMFVLQKAESMALAKPFLRQWQVPQKFRVGIIETELHPAMLGKRLRNMFPKGAMPDNIRFLASESLKQWRREQMKGKLSLLEKWISDEGIEVLMIDIASDFFRGTDDPNKETAVGEMFDLLRNLPVKAVDLVRHDRKQRPGEDQYVWSSNELISGSGEWKHDPELILYLKRADRRTHEVYFEVGKLRYGSKPEPMDLWFDAGNFRLTPLPPVIAVLTDGPKSREELVRACGWRFHLGHAKVDEMIAHEKPFLGEAQRGHEKVFEIDLERAKQAPWGKYLGETVQDTESSRACRGLQAAVYAVPPTSRDAAQDTGDSVSCTSSLANDTETLGQTVEALVGVER